MRSKDSRTRHLDECRSRVYCLLMSRFRAVWRAVPFGSSLTEVVEIRREPSRMFLRGLTRVPVSHVMEDDARSFTPLLEDAPRGYLDMYYEAYGRNDSASVN